MLIPDFCASNGDSHPTCVRTLLDIPGALGVSGGNGDHNGNTELEVPPGKICVTVVPENGVVLKNNGLLVWSRSSSFES